MRRTRLERHTPMSRGKGLKRPQSSRGYGDTDPTLFAAPRPVQPRRTCGKRRYRDKVTAEIALAKIWARDTGRSEKMPRRAYECGLCDGYHLTSQPPATYPRPIRQVIKARSNARAMLMVHRRALVARLLEERPWCEVQLPGCFGRSVDCHERLRRSQGGDVLDETDILTVCRFCHDWIGLNPAEAERRGWARWGMRAPSNPEGGAA